MEIILNFREIKDLDDLLKKAEHWIDYGPIEWLTQHDMTDILDDIQEYFDLDDGMARDVWSKIKPDLDNYVQQLKSEPETSGDSVDKEAPPSAGVWSGASWNYPDLIVNFSEFYDISEGKAKKLLDYILPKMGDAASQARATEGLGTAFMRGILPG